MTFPQTRILPYRGSGGIGCTLDTTGRSGGGSCQVSTVDAIPDPGKTATCIKTLPGAASRFYALLGVAEQLLHPR